MAVGRFVSIAALALTLVACEAAAPIAPPVDASGTALQPLPPDPAFEEAGRRVCLVGGELGNHVQLMPLALQDQRRDDMAYLVYADGGVVVECLLERRGLEYQMHAGSSGPVPEPAQALAVDGTATIREDGFIVTGAAPAPVAAVVVQRDDGVQVQAKVAAGRFVAWWTTGGQATTVIGYAADGREVTRVR